MPDKIFEAKTVQTANIKTLFEVLKKILVEVNLIITNKGIKIITINDSEISLVHLFLAAENFEYFFCEKTEEEPFIFGIYTENLYKIMKTVKHDETISLFSIDKNVLNIQKDNTNRNTVTKYSLDIHSIPYHNLSIEKIEYDAIITLKSSEFNKICKDYSGLLGAKVLEIKNIGQSLILDSVGDICKSKTIYGNSNNTLFDIKVEDNIIQGRYNLTYLVLFSKACNLSNNVEIFLKNDCPLILLYKVGTLGEMKFMLSPEK